MDDEMKQRFDTIDGNLKTISDRLGRQVAVAEGIRSDIRVLTGISQGILTMMQAMVGGYTDLSSRVTDLENPTQ